MGSRDKNIEIALLVLANTALVGIWAINGYDETWLYVTAMLITIPTSWLRFGRNRSD